MTIPSTLAAIALSAALVAPGARDEEPPAMVFQIRTYATEPGKLDVLVDRFSRVNLPLFDRHGIALVGAWTPHESDEGPDRLVYLVAFPDREEAEDSWRAFAEDPEWVEAFEAEMQEHGQVVTDVETSYLAPTDYSPPLPPADPAAAGDDDKDDRGRQGGGPRLFELRRYVASPGKIDDLNARFRDHTMELFAKHGMTNVLYTMPIDGDSEAESDADSILLYFVSHAGHAEALNSWEGFRSDPAWTAAREASQPDGVPLAAEVTSSMLVPTEFSPLR